MSSGDGQRPKVGLLWRREWDPPETDAPVAESCRLHGVFSAFQGLGVAAEPVIYADDWTADIREQLLSLDGVLVWVNPIEQGLDRSRLDALLREVSEAGVWVSAHPDVIARMATKRVLFDTRAMSWGTDTRLYLSADELRAGLGTLDERGPRVLKRERGMGGHGVWKIEREDDAIRVQEALRGAVQQRLTPDGFAAQCEPYFEHGGVMVEQPFQERIAEGMIRVYFSHDQVVGFAHQYPAGLRPESAGEPPAGKTFETAGAPAFERLRLMVESEWVPQMQAILGLETLRLPVIWDADFLYGPKTASGEDTYVLCEINASSTFSFPEHAMPSVAATALARIVG